MHQPALMGIIECIGQAGADPAHGVGERRARQKPERGTRAGEGGRAFRSTLGQTLDDLPAGAIGERSPMKAVQDGGPRRSTQKRHAERPQILFGKILNQIQRHDVCVLQSGQREMLLPGGRRQFHHQRPIGERRLSRQKDSPLPTAA